MLNSLHTPLFEIPADLSGMPRNYNPYITDWGTIDESNFLDVLELKVGARVIMTHNKDVSDGLVNGVTGKVLDFVWRKSQIIAIIVEFDDEEVGRKFRKEN